MKIRSVSLHILVEPPLKGFAHACTVDDILQMLQLIPDKHLKDISLIVLRQPKRKERILSLVGGRLVYWSEIDPHSGPAIYLESQDVSRPLKWKKSLTPDRALELERLRQDGHSIVSDKRHHVIASTLDSVRSTQLYRTLPYEIGHYVDYLEKVEDPSGGDLDKCIALEAKYHSRPTQEKEAFANRYADEFRKHKTADGFLPFDRILDEAKIKRLGMVPEWFTPPIV